MGTRGGDPQLRLSVMQRLTSFGLAAVLLVSQHEVDARSARNSAIS